jgi:hypothetical protein
MLDNLNFKNFSGAFANALEQEIYAMQQLKEQQINQAD